MPSSTFAAGDPPPLEGLTFAPLAATDLDAVLEIEVASFPVPWSRAHFEGELADPHSINRVVRLDGRAVAYASSWQVDREYRIHNIAVAEALRGQRVGSWLLGRLLRDAARCGCREATLEVRAGNGPARRLYRRHGFVEVGRRKGYYRPEREDAVLMTATLPGPGETPPGDTLEP